METPGPVPTNKRRFRHGGLMRCCTGTLAETDDMSDIGSVQKCHYCTSGIMVVAPDGVWQWDQEAGLTAAGEKLREEYEH